MGCGKSSVGRELSELLCCRFIDLDGVICEKAGKSVPEIFASEGEVAFRRMEKDALREIVEEFGRVEAGDDDGSGAVGGCKDRADDDDRPGDLVLALGGGTVMTPECASLVYEHTFCIYLKASVETLLSHLGSEAVGRPLLKSSDNGTADLEALRRRITGLMELRSATYESVSHLILDTDGKNISDIAVLCKEMSK